MSLRIEWRSRDDTDDALFAIDDETDVVEHVWHADPGLLADFLNDMGDLDSGDSSAVDDSELDPSEWGDLVIARSEEGDVLFIEPQRYWEGIARLYRSRGDDPHPWRGRR